MSFDTKSDWQKRMFPGVGAERIAERTMGCWSCLHWNLEKAQKLWWDEARNNLLQRAVVLALKSPLGENSQPVRNIRAQVPLLDQKMTIGEWGCCSRGKKPDGTSVDDFVHRTYLCEVWSGKEGASVAREGQATDKLPEELMEDVMDPKGGPK